MRHACRLRVLPVTLLLLWAPAVAAQTAFRTVDSFHGINGPPGHRVPDPTIAAAIDRILLGTNTTLQLRTKTGGIIDRRDLTQFFAPVAVPGTEVFDPWVHFDPGSRRFFIVAANKVFSTNCAPTACVSKMLIAVSRDARPVGLAASQWHFYALDQTLHRRPDGTVRTATWADFDHLAVVGNVVVVTSRVYRFDAVETQRGAKIRLIDRDLLVHGEGREITRWFDLFGMTDPFHGGRILNAMQPAITFGDTDGTVFLVGTSPCFFTIWGVANALTAPVLTQHKIGNGGACEGGVDAPQPGNVAPLDVAAQGFNTLPVYRNGRIWAAQPIAHDFDGTLVSTIHWAQIDVRDWPAAPGLVQEGLFGGGGVAHFNPALMVDGQNNMVMLFARSSTTEFPSLYYTGRLADDPPGTLRSPTLVKAGTVSLDQVDSTGRNRFGDYFGAAMDPDDGTMWLFGEYPRDADAWSTRVARVVANRELRVTAMTMVDPPERVAPGAQLTVSDTVKNLGPARAGASTTRYYLSPDSARSGADVRLTGDRAVPPLSAGGTSTGRLSVTVPPSTSAGEYFVLACADDRSAVPERDETNNCLASRTVVIVAP